MAKPAPLSAARASYLAKDGLHWRLLSVSGHGVIDGGSLNTLFHGDATPVVVVRGDGDA